MDPVVTHQGYCERLSRSLSGIAAGFAIFVAGLCLAGWNEYRCVATLKTIAAAEAAYIDVACFPVDPANADKLVHVACPLSNYVVFSSFAGLKSVPAEEVKGVRLVRSVEVFEWVEESTTEERNAPNGGKERVTTYSYTTEWSSTYQDPSKFSQPTKCANVYNGGRPCTSTSPMSQSWWASGPQTLGKMQVGRAEKLKLGGFQDACPPYMQIIGNYVYYRNQVGRDVDVNQDFSGDVRMLYTLYNTSDASVLAMQSGSAALPTFAPWRGPYDKSYTMYMVEDGVVSADSMLRDAEAYNALVTWALRGVTFLAVFVGLQLVIAPITIVADVIPCVGHLISGLAGSILCCFSCLVATFCWTLVVSTAWLAFRPLLGVPLLLAAIVSIIGAAWWKRYNDRKGTELALANPQNIFSPILAAAGYCPSCGAARKDKGGFCGECGAEC